MQQGIVVGVDMMSGWMGIATTNGPYFAGNEIRERRPSSRRDDVVFEVAFLAVQRPREIQIARKGRHTCRQRKVFNLSS